MPMREMLEEYVMLAKRLRDVADEQDTVKAKLAELEPNLLEEFGLAGIQNVNCDGLTVYVKKDRFVNKKAEKDGVTTGMLVERLRENGFSDLCSETYSSSALKSRLLEILDGGGDIPVGVAQCVNISEALKLATRKSG